MQAERLQNVITTRWRGCVGGLLLVAVLAVRSWVVAPHLASLNAAQRFAQATAEHIEKSESLDRKLRGSRKHLEKLTAEHDRLSASIFSPGEADRFLGSLETICQQCNCGVVSLSFTSPRKKGLGGADSFVTAQGAALTVHGSYSSITRLVEAFQTCREKVWIDGLHMTESAAGTGEITCRMTLTIYVNLRN